MMRSCGRLSWLQTQYMVSMAFFCDWLGRSSESEANLPDLPDLPGVADSGAKTGSATMRLSSMTKWHLVQNCPPSLGG